MHCKPAEVSTSAFDTLLGIDLELAVIEKWTRRKTGMSANPRDASSTQRALNTEIKPRSNTATREIGMSEKEVKITFERVGSKARENTVKFGDDRVKKSQTLLPTGGIRWDWSPGRNLFRCVILRGQRANRRGINFDYSWQVDGLKWSQVHVAPAECLRPKLGA